MNSPLTVDVWQRKGISVLWDSKTLTQLNCASQVISLRQFFTFYEEKWPEDMPLIKGDMLLVAGLDAALDTLSAEESQDWLNKDVLDMILDFQKWAQGENALIFWMSDQNRWKEHYDNKYTWFCDGKDKGLSIDIGIGLWNGAQQSVRHIENEGKWLGLYLERIS